MDSRKAPGVYALRKNFFPGGFPVRKILCLTFALLLTTVAAQAQGTDLFLGYSFGAIEAGSTTASNNADGFTVAMSNNFGPYFSWTTDFGTHFGDTNDVLLALSPLRSFSSLQIFTGPQINIRAKKWNVFLRALGGIQRQTVDGFTLSAADCAGLGIDCSLLGGTLQTDGSFLFPSETTTKFAMKYGIGFDWYFARRVGWRVVQVDYMPVRSTDPNRNWRQNATLATGLVFRF